MEGEAIFEDFYPVNHAVAGLEEDAVHVGFGFGQGTAVVGQRHHQIFPVFHFKLIGCFIETFSQFIEAVGNEFEMLAEIVPAYFHFVVTGLGAHGRCQADLLGELTAPVDKFGEEKTERGKKFIQFHLSVLPGAAHLTHNFHEFIAENGGHGRLHPRL